MSYILSHEQTHTGLLSDPELVPFFSAETDVQSILDFEIALANAEAECGMISEKSRDEIAGKLSGFNPDLQDLASGMMQDGMIVPALLRQARAQLSEEAAKALHLGSTSQDAIDTSAMMRMKSAHNILVQRMESICLQLDELQNHHGSKPLMAYTRMQAALPIKVSDRIRNWCLPLKKLQSTTLSFPLQLGGPVGASDAFSGNREKLATLMSDQLMLNDTSHCWHTDRTPIIEICNWLASLTGHLGKIGQDVALMAMLGDTQIVLASGGGSSAMAHKKNPVAAETLVALASYNAAQMSAIHGSLVHEMERSGSQWMVEWMVLPQIHITAGAALNATAKLLGSIETMGTP